MTSERPVPVMLDRVEIEETALRMGQAADQCNWETLVGCFTGEVYRDYSSLTGQEPGRTGARDLVEGEWAPVLGNLDATQHFTGPCTIKVEGDRATGHAYFQARHVLANVTGDDVWILGGRYDWDFVRTGEGWKISGVTMTAMWAEGNQNIMTLAAARGQQSEPAR